MSYKITCPGCNSTTTENTRGFLEEGKCPTCGLSVDVLDEINRVRESHATTDVKAQYEAMAVRAGVAEAKVHRLTRRLERIQEAIDSDHD